jgi:hypothetical protein
VYCLQFIHRKAINFHPKYFSIQKIFNEIRCKMCSVHYIQRDTYIFIKDSNKQICIYNQWTSRPMKYVKFQRKRLEILLGPLKYTSFSYACYVHKTNGTTNDYKQRETCCWIEMAIFKHGIFILRISILSALRRVIKHRTTAK